MISDKLTTKSPHSRSHRPL